MIRRYSVVFSSRADRQILALFAFIAEHDGIARAEDFVGGVIADCLTLAAFPERGTTRDDIRPNLRIKGYQRRVSIAFEVDKAAAEVTIFGVFYGGQNIERQIRKRRL